MPTARMPDLEALALFLAVARSGSLGAAARLLGISQPAASQRVRALERQLGYVLLERTPTGSRLTDAGRVTTEWAAPLVAAALDFGRNTQALTAAGQQLSIAASLTVADYLMPGWLIALHDLLPAVTIALTPANSQAVGDLVARQEVALGFIEGPDVPDRVRARAIGEDSLVLVVAPGHPWAARGGPVAASELARASLVLREPTSGTRRVLDRALAAYRLTLHPRLELGSTTAIKEAVRGGTSVTVLSRLAVRDDVARGHLVELRTPELDLRRIVRGIWHPRQVPAGPAGALLALAERSLSGQAGK